MGGMRAAGRFRVHVPNQLRRHGLDFLLPKRAVGLAQEGQHICMRLAAPQHHPRLSAGVGQGGSEGWAPLSRAAARSRLALPQAEPPSPAPSSCSLVLAGAAQTCSGAAAPAWIASGLCPRDRATGAGWAPWHCQVRVCPGVPVGGPQPAGVFSALLVWEPTAVSLLPRSTSFPSSLAPPALFSPFSSPSVSSPCLLCLFAVSAPTLCVPKPSLCPLPCLSPSPLPLCLFLPPPFSPFLFFLFSFSRPPFLSLFHPSPLLFPPCYPVFHSSIPFLLVLPPTLVPSFPLASLFPEEGKDCQVCVCSGGTGAQPQTPGRVPSPQEEREERTVGRVLCPAPFLRPLRISPSPRMKFWRPGLTPRAEDCPAGPSHRRPPFPLLPIPQTSTSDCCLPFRDQAASFDLSVSRCHSVSVSAGQSMSLGFTLSHTVSIA